MKKVVHILLLIIFFTSIGTAGQCQETVTVRPEEIHEVLNNPGIGFMTFQRFNGDTLNAEKTWTEGFPIDYQSFDGDLTNDHYPNTTLAYFRIYWKFLEPEKNQYNWVLIDQALATAASRGQSLLLRIAPYGTGPERDVPGWYRDIMGVEEDLPDEKWQTDPEDPRYVQNFGGMIRALGERYNGHPDLESVDMALVGAWGEGAGSEMLTDKTRKALVDCYLEAFPDTHLIMLLTDAETNQYGISQRNVGWRVDCLGDMGGFSPTWSHMNDYYPQSIIQFGMQDAWKKAPVTLEVCWVMEHWKEMGWDVDYIIDQSLKWHISSFNAKSSPVPEDWEPHVARWLNKMGYRFVLRKFTYPQRIRAGENMPFTSWWENKGVAPCYHRFPLAILLSNPEHKKILITGVDIRDWLPGDNLYDSSIQIPENLQAGEYELSIGVLDESGKYPKVKLAIEGMNALGWYPMGRIKVVE